MGFTFKWIPGDPSGMRVFEHVNITMETRNVDSGSYWWYRAAILQLFCTDVLKDL